MNKQFLRLLGALFAVALITSACGSQDDSASADASNDVAETTVVSEPEATEPETTEPEVSATDTTSPEDGVQETAADSEAPAITEVDEVIPVPDEPTPEEVVVDAPDEIVEEVDVRITASVLDGVVTLEGDDRVEASVGDTVLIEVSGDSEELIHLHGFNIFQDLTPDTPAVIEFVPEAPGRFEIEVERTGAFIAELVVS